MRIEPATTLGRHTSGMLADLHQSKEPILITEHGQPSAYLVDVEDFEAMQTRMRILEGLSRGERAIQEGRTLTHEEVKKTMAKWLK